MGMSIAVPGRGRFDRTPSDAERIAEAVRDAFRPRDLPRGRRVGPSAARAASVRVVVDGHDHPPSASLGGVTPAEAWAGWARAYGLPAAAAPVPRWGDLARRPSDGRTPARPDAT